MKGPFSMLLAAITVTGLVAGSGCQQNQTAANVAQTPSAGAPTQTSASPSPATPTSVLAAAPTPGIANSPVAIGSPTVALPLVASPTVVSPTITSTTVASPTVASPTTSSNDAATVAVIAVIKRANEEQQEAFAKNDPTIMKDTSTADYYNQMAQTNSHMADIGITAIKLERIEWGAITFPSATTAKATTYETWQTTFADGSTDEHRDQNNYTLVLEQGVWKIQADDIPNSGPGAPPNL